MKILNIIVKKQHCFCISSLFIQKDYRQTKVPRGYLYTTSRLPLGYL